MLEILAFCHLHACHSTVCLSVCKNNQPTKQNRFPIPHPKIVELFLFLLLEHLGNKPVDKLNEMLHFFIVRCLSTAGKKNIK